MGGHRDGPPQRPRRAVPRNAHNHAPKIPGMKEFVPRNVDPTIRGVEFIPAIPEEPAPRRPESGSTMRRSLKIDRRLTLGRSSTRPTKPPRRGSDVVWALTQWLRMDSGWTDKAPNRYHRPLRFGQTSCPPNKTRLPDPRLRQMSGFEALPQNPSPSHHPFRRRIFWLPPPLRGRIERPCVVL
jgi:hypothetical protein